ncbi:MAG: glycosyltransferase family 2 protein [Patescibacteria group bacterium]
MDVTVIIVNWNTKKLLQDCLESIYKFTKGISFEVIVVDNASEDGSQTMVRQKFPQVKLIQNKNNAGFATANNQGIREAKGKYIFLLNSDAYLIENSLKKLLEIGDSNKNLGVLCPLLLNEDKSIQQSVGFSPNLWRVFLWMTFIDDLPFGYLLKPFHVDHDAFYKNSQEIDWASGAAILIPKTVIKKAGLLDEKIFMYGEDVEWCYRIKVSGFSNYFSPKTKIIHIGRGSSGKIAKNAFLGEYIGLIYFYKKHRGVISLQLLLVFLKIGALARIFIFSILGRKELAKVYEEAFKVAG